MPGFDRCVELAPDLAEAYQARGHAPVAMKDYRRAIADHNEALRLKPALVGALGGRGKARRALNSIREAMADFDEVIRLSPDRTGPLILRGGSSEGKLLASATDDDRRTEAHCYLGLSASFELKKLRASGARNPGKR